jgi:hypothetical protein
MTGGGRTVILLKHIKEILNNVDRGTFGGCTEEPKHSGFGIDNTEHTCKTMKGWKVPKCKIDVKQFTMM